MDIIKQLKTWVVFVSKVRQKFYQDGCFSIAAELTIVTLFALVPMLTLVLQLAQAFPSASDLNSQLQSLAFNYLLPESVDSLGSHLTEFASKARGMSSIGVILLLLSAVALLRTIEKSFAKIWGGADKRKTVTKFLIYWAVLTLGPIFIGTSIGVTTYISSKLYISEVIQDTQFATAVLLPFMLATIGYSCLFWFVPNANVRVKHALYAALISAFIFEMTKRAFVLFVNKFSTYHLVFGALALLPLLIIWLQLAWMITLLGAQFCYAFAHNFADNLGKRFNPLLVSLALLKKIEHGQVSKNYLHKELLFERFRQIDPVQIESVLTVLMEQKILGELTNGDLCLLVDKESVTLQVLLQFSGFYCPQLSEVEKFSKQFDIGFNRLKQEVEHFVSQSQQAIL